MCDVKSVECVYNFDVFQLLLLPVLRAVFSRFHFAIMASANLKITALSKVSSTSRRFALKMRLEGDMTPQSFQGKDGASQYISCAGIDDADDRASIAFFGKACTDVIALQMKPDSTVRMLIVCTHVSS